VYLGQLKNVTDETESKMNTSQEVLQEWLKTQPKTFHFDGIRKHVSHSTKCIVKESNVRVRRKVAYSTTA
jgi:hypothetical protein